MTDRLPAPVRRVTDTFKAFTPGQKAVTIFAVIALIVGGYFFATWAAKPSYQILFNNLSTKDASAIVEALQKSGASYELANDGSTILVPRDQVNALRLQLSGEGLPNDEGTGYSLLDQQGITTSDFMQHTNYQRALEGELATTIKSIDGVEAATVRLVMPQKDVFADDQSKPTASVLVASKGNGTLTSDQVQSIVHLVASSVEGLDPTQVTVAGADGRLLSSGGGATIGAGGESGTEQQTAAFESRLNNSLQSMLNSLVGPGNAVVTSRVSLDFDQTETRSKKYTADPATPAESESINTETYSGSGTGQGGVLGPDNIQVPNNAGSGQYNNKNEVRNRQLDEVEEVRRNAPGSIEKLDVSVLMNSAVAGSVDPAQIQELLSAAAGIDATRGDTIAVASMPFDTSAANAAQESLTAATAAETEAKQLTLIKTGALLFVVLALIFLAWRANKRAKKRQQLTAEERKHLEDMQAALEAQRRAELDVTTATSMNMNVLESPSMAGQNDEAREERQKEIDQLVKEKPEETAALIRSWLSADSTR
ncbi:flagellar M-ring protein FliF [Actinoplanes lutulentus]|uniref:Flagellar M-ring protein n=1 Tax=Actinoplanes lutulentus TaxID=1287878 RepID=A0A327ZBW5_9ACTN|nr:flagellar basal-body MS-ring/collar protein FliF [Actinoplanes lutulentus]MBB2945867.1 flagellar M-ring protein FliF [Actinoplanes lutulentus]RAK37916.1 flagellar M-ring protein FliF [Actinoplanes lutulentus]